MKNKNILIVLSLFLLLMSCYPEVRNNNGDKLAGPADLAKKIGIEVGNKASGDLKENLAGPIKNVKIMEETASKIKRGFPLSQDIQVKGKTAYTRANATLTDLKNSIKSDINNKSRTFSTSTKNNADKYAQDVASLKQVYADASGSQDKSATLIGALGIIKEGFDVWSSYNESRKEILLKAVDAELKSKSWNEIQ